MFIDLSVSINEETPIYPGDPKTRVESAGTFGESGYQDHFVCMGTHVGTHMDAPSHMIEDGKNLDQFPIGKFSGNGVYVKYDEGFSLESLKQVAIHEDDIVIFNTDMSKKYAKADYFEIYPSISEEIASYLAEKKIKMLGIDMCSVDHDASFPIHKILLRNEILIIENLTNLSALEDKDFKIHAFPIKLQLDGAPVRVVAEIV